MKLGQIESELVAAGLHEESVERLVTHYEDMRFHLGTGRYVEAGAHIGNFCESYCNIILAETDQGALPRINVGTFVDEITSNKYDTSNLPEELKTTVPRAIRTAYDIRNNRDSVHVNLDTPVSHSDTQAAVRLCSWMLAELLRLYGREDHIDDVATQIEELATPQTPYIDNYEEKRIIMSQEMTPREEILVHLHAMGSPVDANRLAEWILGSSTHRVKSIIGNLKQSRKVHYEDGMAKITPLGVKQAEQIISENFENGIEDLSRRTEQID